MKNYIKKYHKLRAHGQICEIDQNFIVFAYSPQDVEYVAEEITTAILTKAQYELSQKELQNIDDEGDLL